MGRASSLVLAAMILLAVVAPTSEASVRLRYVGRYDTQSTYHDHLVGVEQVGDHHALVSSNLDIVIVDLESLPVDGAQTYVDRLPGLDVQNTVTRADGYVYANLRMGGLAVVHFDDEALTLTALGTVSEPNVFFEKMAVVGDRLYVAAHSAGIRVYGLDDPEQPELSGALVEGFDDAFAIAVDGSTAYVADGAGGLKVVDLTDESSPLIVGGETPSTAAGTAEDVIVVDGHVYVACGGAGVAHYSFGDVASRVLYDTPICAKQVVRQGQHLVVADVGGLEIFAMRPDGSLARVAGESGRRRSAGGEAVTLRLWEGVSAWGDERILAATWDSMDVYELVDSDIDTQPDLTISTDRLRFPPGGGGTIVKVVNDGSGVLQITDVHATSPAFSVAPSSGTLLPGAALELSVGYEGGQPGSGLIFIESNDPDESPMPIEVFGATAYLDPGEPAVPFTLQSWTFDHDDEVFLYDEFDLAAHRGRIVFFHVFGLG